MMKTKKAFIAALPLAAAWSIALAQAQAPSAGGDSNAGRQIATSGANGAAACASCHGAQGEGNAAANFPRIAGQPQSYFVRQMTAFADGSRNNPVMTPIAKALNRDQINAVAAYYAALDAPSKPAPPPAANMQKRGTTLAATGDEKLGVQGCYNCHGPGGSGEPPNYPYLSGQHNGYLVAALGEWKSGARKTDPSQQMNLIAKRLSDADIAAVSAFFAAQPAPPPAARRGNIPSPGSATAQSSGSSGSSGPPGGAASTPVQGIGTEQGAPTTGTDAGQGPGGASGAGPSGSPTGTAK